MKLQALTLPNGMFGSVYIGPLHINYDGLTKMSSMDSCLS